MESSKKYRSVQIIVEILSVSLQLIAIVSPGWVGELHPNRSFYSSLFYGVICELECKFQTHYMTYTAARRDNITDKAVAGRSFISSLNFLALCKLRYKRKLMAMRVH